MNTDAVVRSDEELPSFVGLRKDALDRLWASTNDLMGPSWTDGCLKTVNPAWSKLLGWTSAELMRRPVSDLIDALDARHASGIAGLLAAGQSVAGFMGRLQPKAGDVRTLMWDAVPDGEYIHFVGRDVTALLRAEDQLRQSQKMEAVGQLTGGIAHDFNNLLTAIGGSLEMMQMRLAQGRIGELDRYLAAAHQATKRAASLTHRLLAFSRRQTLVPLSTNINRLVIGMEELVRRTMGPEILVETVIAGGLWNTMVDPHQLENALLNLCLNARDAMAQGGHLIVETSNTWLDERAGGQRDLPPGHYVSLCVSDNGVGMDKDVLERVFEPFFTTKALGAGTGLGLSMVYGFARQSGGQVRIYSEPGLGARVCLYLPRHLGPEDVAVDPPAAAVLDRREGDRRHCVLVVDDEPSIRMLVSEVLEDMGCVVIEAGDGPTAVAILESPARIDLLLTDVGLPHGLNGRQLVAAARACRPALPVLYITGYAQNAAVGHGHVDRGMQVLTKPFALAILASRVRELLAEPATPE